MTIRQTQSIPHSAGERGVSPARARDRARARGWSPARARAVRRRRRYLAGLLAAIALLAGVGLSSFAAATPSSGYVATIALRAPAGTPVLDVGGPLPVAPIAPGFVGLSIEYYALPAYMGSDGLDPVFLALVRNLNPGQAPVLRIGGDSADFSWVPVPGMEQPPGVTYTITPAWLHALAALVGALHARVVLDVDLEADSPEVAQTEARALVSAVGRSSVEALEVGNEPELYPSFPWYFTPSGIGVPGRPPSYDIGSYVSDYERWAPALPSLPLAGPVTGSLQWISELGQFVPAAPRLGLVTVHRYPLQNCYVPVGSPKYPSIGHLLAPYASAGGQGFGTSTGDGLLQGDARVYAVRAVNGAYALALPPYSAALLTLPPSLQGPRGN